MLGGDVSGARGDRLLFTGGGTEANNLAVLGVCRAASAAGQIVVSAVEHASVIEPAEHLMEEGWRLDGLGVDARGVVCVDRLQGLLSAQTRLVSVLLANHETGVLQPIADLAEICNAAGVVLHTDAVQAAGKLPLEFRRLGVAAMSVTAHKFRGPLGIGALLVRHNVPLSPLTYGGGQQHALRPGTECVALAVGMATALRLAHQHQQEEAERQASLRTQFEAGLRAAFPGVIVHGGEAQRLPNTANVAFPGVDGQVLLMALDTAGVACSAGSACSSGSSEVSPTLLAMGIPHSLASSSLRFSLGAETRASDIEQAVRRIAEVYRQLRG